MSKVYIVGGGYAYQQMFHDQGWEVVEGLDDGTNLIQFTGGEDVTPSFYGEDPHPETGFNKNRDEWEKTIFNYALAHNIPMAGICRGGQFLHVMNGERLWQHVDGHAIGHTHEALYRHHDGEDRLIHVSSTHHQMMRPGKGEIIMEAAESTYYHHMGQHGVKIKKIGDHNPLLDVEAVYHKNSNSLCFQPHPEFDRVKPCRDAYFEMIGHYLGVDDGKIDLTEYV